MLRNKLGVFLGFAIFITALFLAYQASASISEGEGNVEVVFIQTKEDADCALLMQGENAVLIDSGEAKDAPHILDVLRENGIENLEYFILSHGDKDHIGGAIEILSEIPAKRVIQPYYDENENMTALNTYLDQENISVLYPAHNTRVRTGGLLMTIYPALEKHYSKENNYSLAVLVQHEKVNLLFPGDALRKRTEELLQIHWPKISLLKVPHHGRANSATENLFEQLKPEIAVVTSEKCDSTVTESAKKVGAKMYFSVLEECIFESDGEVLTSK